jgi:4-amino-4-deoxy-L-arabinose transferase-like glycosyltransferase
MKEPEIVDVKPKVVLNGSTNHKLVSGYLKGRIPFRIWLFSGLAGALVIVINNLVHHHAILEGFFSVFFLNLLITIPLFLAQAHVIGLVLQRKPKKVRTALTIVLIAGWAVMGTIIGMAMYKIYEGKINPGAVLMIFNYILLIVMWVALSFLALRVKRKKH